MATFSHLGLFCGNVLASTANILETKTMTGAVSSLLHFINAKQTHKMKELHIFPRFDERFVGFICICQMPRGSKGKSQQGCFCKSFCTCELPCNMREICPDCKNRLCFQTIVDVQLLGCVICDTEYFSPLPPTRAPFWNLNSISEYTIT